ncbi:MAG: hypothetical protein IPH62_13185 [Ignavibacteriae bacterium]|nr:hypothetical protein [Ignavibacteriota bacterium]
MHISFKSMQHIISILYQYDCSDEKTKLEKPFRIKIEPVVLTVKNSDYIEFKSILENAIIENYNLPDFTHYKIFTN